VKVVWNREEDIQHDMYRPYWFDRLSAGLDDKGRPVAWNNRFAGSSVMSRWLPPAFKDGLDPDSTEGAIDLVYDLPNFHVEYVRLEPPGIPTAFWRSVGPSHNVSVTESFIDELAAAAKQDAVAYRRALLDKSPRARAVLDLAAEKAGWGQALPKGIGRGVSLQFVFGSYLAQVADQAKKRIEQLFVASKGQHRGHLAVAQRVRDQINQAYNEVQQNAQPRVDRVLEWLDREHLQQHAD
jgi:isoquinoline 1-oxidoreductase beta subunit